jgi:Flp pilus assembly protein TadD
MAHLNLAEAYGRDGQDNMAVEQAREVVRLAPDNPMAHRALGAMLGRSHQPDAALRELRLAAGMEQPNADTQTLIGAQLAVMYGHVDEAIAAFQQALSLNPNMVVAKEGLERAQLLKSKLASEVEKQHAAVQSNPNDPDAFYRLAKAEAYSGDFAAAIRDLQKSASLRPGSGTPHAELADIYLSRGDAGSAWDEVRKARALGTEPPPTLLARLPAQ